MPCKIILDYPNFCFYETTLEKALDLIQLGLPLWVGQYSCVWEREGDLFLARDPLGCNKLFFGLDGTGSWVVTNRFSRALELGVAMDSIVSCPPGRLLRLDSDGAISVLGGQDISLSTESASWNLEHFRDSVKSRLAHTFESLAARHSDKTFVVCLSGGLDSSAIATLAKHHFKNVSTATFTYIDEVSISAYLDGASLNSLSSLSDDFRHATGVAECLNLPLIPVLRTKSAVLSSICQVLHLCQDWRDFNVHCAIVNLFLAQDIRAAHPGKEVIVLTGDLMNEYVCDYHEETVDGKTYYPQPRVPMSKRRRFFVRGLDAGDREIGIFNAFGLSVIQPFASVADLYLGVPAAFLEQENAKDVLNGHLLSNEVYLRVSKAKQRAQVGGKDMGTLGIFHFAGLDQKALGNIWKNLLPAAACVGHPHDLIQVGRYRTNPRRN